jgi:hypothetical protein
MTINVAITLNGLRTSVESLLNHFCNPILAYI